MTEATVTALIAAAASVVVAVVSAMLAARAGRRVSELDARLERQRVELEGELSKQQLLLSSRLEEQRSARSARRDYEYEARKRLYAECEPLLFEALELARGGRHRVLSLARSARRNAIRPDGTGWLSAPGYYFQSTTYLLLAPVTTSRILQRRLTQIDLSLEPRLRLQYELLKLLFLVFTDDHDLAAAAPALPYDPDRADPGEPDREKLLAEEPQVYGRQGFYLGMLEVIAERLVVRTETTARCRSFGEFLSDLDDPKSGVAELVPVFQEVFGGFHPLRAPALWRVLMAQYLLYEAFLQTQRWPAENLGTLAGLVDLTVPQDLTPFDWRSSPEQASDAAIREPLEVACAYLARRLKALDEQMAT
jgi:hypothetical protein